MVCYVCKQNATGSDYDSGFEGFICRNCWHASVKRIPVCIEDGLRDLSFELQRRLNEKGYGAFINNFEGLGILEIEVDELKKEIHNRDNSKVSSEALDVAVAALMIHMSIKTYQKGGDRHEDNDELKLPIEKVRPLPKPKGDPS